MTSPFLAEIRMFAGSFAPSRNAFCDGALLPIQQYSALFSLIGVSFGGNGTSNFGLPNLQGSIPIGTGAGPGLSPRVIGESGGSAGVTLLQNQMPQHNHVMNSISPRAAVGVSAPVTGAAFTKSGNGNAYAPYATTPPTVALAPLPMQGGSLPHNNVMPSLPITFIIALQGVFPQRN
ncbi:phage tail protein [Pseudolysobacter antarcticus]|uniref:Phage tail protein n=1 Tax=Pseudolysobacter antarcticus TaxID=2511995 RepID=A0A411HN60_9GAMM|nr:tail fiber protein [Pseudolysobacter antarcticus]QBB71917.1 phage tail protein [Pseudolysobacter antarcticus]